MLTLKSLESYHHTQGYNQRQMAPDLITRLGGGCQASVELFTLRYILNNPDLTMAYIENMSRKCGVGFFDLEYATKISFAAIPLITEFALPRHRVDFYHEKNYDDIHSQEPINFFGAESKRVYIQLHNKPTTHYSSDADTQLAAVQNTLRAGGVAIPLLHTNTLYRLNHKKRDGLLHVVSMVGIDVDDNLTIVDPDPGFLNTFWYSLLYDIGLLRIRSGKLDFTQTQKYAKKHHPYESIQFTLPSTEIRKAMRFCTVTINPLRSN